MRSGPGAAVAGLPPVRAHGQVGLQFRGLGGAVPLAQTERRRSPGGAATPQSSDGSEPIGASNAAHDGFNKAVPSVNQRTAVHLQVWPRMGARFFGNAIFAYALS